MMAALETRDELCYRIGRTLRSLLLEIGESIKAENLLFVEEEEYREWIARKEYNLSEEERLVTRSPNKQN